MMSSTLSRSSLPSIIPAFQRKLKPVLDAFNREILDFRTLHSDFELILVSLGVVLILPYILNNHLFDLLDEVNFIINHQDADFIILLSRGSETILILSAIVILLNFYFSKQEAVSEAKEKYFGEAHKCLTISRVPAHLVYKEIRPDDDSAAIYHSGFDGTGKTEDEFLALNSDSIQLTKDAESYTKAYKEFFASDIIIPQPQNSDSESPRYISLADLLGDQLDETDSNTTIN